jgi:hypothetical protein
LTEIPRTRRQKEFIVETIIAGRFETLAAAQQAEAMLIGREFPAEDICTLSVNPPGQHATFPIGGDEFADDGSRGAGSDAVKGGVIGGTLGLGAGLAVAAAVPPVGAAAVVAAATGVGAYTGSLAGALHGLGENEQENKQHEDSTEPPPEAPRPAGVLVAVRANDRSVAKSAQQTLQETGAKEIEIAAGVWRDGTWADFNPLSFPLLLR